MPFACPLCSLKGDYLRGIGVIVAMLCFALDQASKTFLLYGLDLKADPRAIEVLPVFDLVMVWNTGVSFGLFSGQADMMRWVLVAVSLAIVALLLWWLRRPEGPWQAAALGLIIGGALGNVLDRLIYGAVADFFSFHVGEWAWPAFNIADSGIVVGVCFLVLHGFFSRSQT